MQEKVDNYTRYTLSQISLTKQLLLDSQNEQFLTTVLSSSNRS